MTPSPTKDLVALDLGIGEEDTALCLCGGAGLFYLPIYRTERT
jgi:hypothetical protein